MMVTAGKLGLEIVKKLKFGKSYIGKKSAKGVEYLGNKGHKRSAKFMASVMHKGNKGINYGAKMAKKYPKSASALGGAAAWDLMSDDS